MNNVAGICLIAAAWCSGVGISAQLCAHAGLLTQSFADLLGVLFVWLCLVMCGLASQVIRSAKREA